VALRSRGLKDDTTCLVVDIIPSDIPVLPPILRKKHNMFSSLFGKKALSSGSKSTKKLSAVGAVEELFEEGSAILAERYADCKIHFLFFFSNSLCKTIEYDIRGKLYP
jgi:hypothetical protein